MFVIFMIIVLFVIARGIYASLKKNRNKRINHDDFIKQLLRQQVINNDQYKYFQTLNQQQQTHFINEQMRMMNEMQQQQFMQQMQQAEMDRLMATGMEFGGFNPDINLNPGQQMQQQQMMNQMNNSGGPGMF